MALPFTDLSMAGTQGAFRYCESVRPSMSEQQATRSLTVSHALCAGSLTRWREVFVAKSSCGGHAATALYSAGVNRRWLYQPWQTLPSSKLVTAGTHTSASLPRAPQHSALSVISEHLWLLRLRRARQRDSASEAARGTVGARIRAPTPQVPAIASAILHSSCNQ